MANYTVYGSCISSTGSSVTLTLKYSDVSPYGRTACAPPECCGKQAWFLPQCLQNKPTGSYDRVIVGVGGCTKYYKHGIAHSAATLVCSEGCT